MTNEAGRSSAKRVLATAYACHPDKGSEPGVGWTWVREIATLYPVTVLTTRSNDSALEKAVENECLDIEVIRVATSIDSISGDSPLRLFRYLAWIYKAGCRVVQLEASGRFFVAHHLTFASDWLPSPLGRLKVLPYVWGPVGGATYPPATLRKEMDAPDRFVELLRRAVTTVSRVSLARKSASRASVIVAMNRDTAKGLRRYGECIVETNAAFDYSAFPDVMREQKSSAFRAVFAGRLLGFKGVSIAIKALSDPRLRQWSLDIFGAGPDEAKLRRMVRDRKLEDRITFQGEVERSTLIESLQSSSVFLFPSMHESASWAVAEATAMGLKVVCFPLGGPPEVAGRNAILLDPANPVGSVVDALLGFNERGVPHRQLEASRIGKLCDQWYDAAVR